MSPVPPYPQPVDRRTPQRTLVSASLIPIKPAAFLLATSTIMSSSFGLPPHGTSTMPSRGRLRSSTLHNDGFNQSIRGNTYLFIGIFTQDNCGFASFQWKMRNGRWQMIFHRSFPISHFPFRIEGSGEGAPTGFHLLIRQALESYPTSVLCSPIPIKEDSHDRHQNHFTGIRNSDSLL
jgi:hypothetical protein